MKRSTSTALGAALTTTTMLTATTLLTGATLGTAVGADATKHQPRVATRFAMSASGFATRYTGGSAPSSSDPSAFDAIGCTNKAGLTNTNTEAGSDPQQSVSTRGARTTVWTAKHGDTVSSWARNTIDNASFGTSSGVLKVHNIITVAHAYYNGKRFVQHSSSRIGSVSLAGTSEDVPTPGNPVTIPGVAKLTASLNDGSAHAHGATAERTALKIRFSGSASTAIVGKARSTIYAGAPLGVFSGQAYATRSTDAGDHTTSGRTPLLVMPCQGTGGAVEVHTTHHTTTGELAAANAKTSERSSQTGKTISMWTQARVSEAQLGSTLTVRNVVARAAVSFRDGVDKRIHRSSRGTSEGSVYVNGTRRTIPKSGRLNIPGVARIQTNLVQRTARGLRVIAMKITMLDGSHLITYLGYASAGVTPSAVR